jgi:hypothetical protein
LGIAEFIVPTGTFFHAQTPVLIPHYRRAFPECEDDPLLAYTKHHNIIDKNNTTLEELHLPEWCCF